MINHCNLTHVPAESTVFFCVTPTCTCTHTPASPHTTRVPHHYTAATTSALQQSLPPMHQHTPILPPMQQHTPVTATHTTSHCHPYNSHCHPCYSCDKAVIAIHATVRHTTIDPTATSPPPRSPTHSSSETTHTLLLHDHPHTTTPPRSPTHSLTHSRITYQHRPNRLDRIAYTHTPTLTITHTNLDMIFMHTYTHTHTLKHIHRSRVDTN
jgi:hypothetical protein